MRYKGRPTAKAIERQYPFIVEIRAAIFNYRERGAELQSWYRERRIQSRDGHGFYLEPDFYVHECFEFLEDAEAFTKQFGGQLLGREHPSKRPLKTGRK